MCIRDSDYIDLRTLAILFSLMTVMAGLRRQGFFDGLGRALLSRTHSTFQLTLVPVSYTHLDVYKRQTL